MIRLRDQHGSAILVTLALILMLSGIGLLSLNRANTDVDLTYNAVRHDQAFYAAEAGLQEAMATINADFAWRKGFAKRKVGDATYWVVVLDSSLSPAIKDDTVVIRSAAIVGSLEVASAAMELWLTPEYYNPFKYALFADSGISMEQASCTDSYNSDSGTYAATVDTLGGDIASNWNIDLQGGSTAGGNISTAGGTLTFSGGSSAYGDTTSTANPFVLDTIPDADVAYAKTNNSAIMGMSGSGFSYDPSTGNLKSGRFGDITLTSGVYYFNDVSLGQSTKLKLAPGAKVTIYLTGTFSAGQDAALNPNGDPADFQVYSKGPSFTLQQGAEFRGAFFGPNADFTVHQNSLLYGSIVAKTAQLEQGSCLHYDRNLLKLKTPQIIAYRTVAWREL